MHSLYLMKRSDRATVDKILADDIIGRQTLTQKEAQAFGLPDDRILLIFEGSEEVNTRLKKLFGEFLEPLGEPNASEVYRKIKDEESQAEDGMGFLFG